MRVPQGFRALRHQTYRRFFLAQLVAMVGTWMQVVTQAWLVLQLTGSPLLLGLLGTLQFGPILLFSVVAGVIADRVSRRRLLLVTQATLALQAWVLAAIVAAGHVRYWHIAVLAVLLGIVNALDTPARQSFVTSVVPRGDLVSAVALNSASFNGARIIGPAVAGLLIARFGLVPSFVINGVGLAVVFFTLLRLPEDRARQTAPARSVRHEMLEGLRYAWRATEIRRLLTLVCALSVTVFNFAVYVPLVTRTVLHLGPEGFGFLMAALGSGSVAGAIALGSRQSAEPGLRLLLGAAALACGGLLILSLAGSFVAAALTLFLTGFVAVVALAGANTALQLAVPDELRGRVTSLYNWVYGGTYPLGSFLIGAISERHGVTVALRVAGLTGLGLMAALAVRTRRPAPARHEPRAE